MTLESRLKALESQRSSDTFCHCGHLRMIDYRDGITEMGGSSEPDVCPNCGKSYGDITVTLYDMTDGSDTDYGTL